MNFHRKRQVSKDHEKGQIIKTLTLKQKVKRHFMKWDVYVSEGGRTQSAYLFLFSSSKLPSFFVSKMSAKKNFVEKL